MTDNLTNGTEHKAQKQTQVASLLFAEAPKHQGKSESKALANYARIASYAYGETMTKFLHSIYRTRKLSVERQMLTMT